MLLQDVGQAGPGSWSWTGESSEMLLLASASWLSLVVGWLVMVVGGRGEGGSSRFMTRIYIGK
jgi:hypothetical protein